MPNACDSSSEKLMTELTNKLNSAQNDLFALLLEGSCQEGKDIEDLRKEYANFEYSDGFDTEFGDGFDTEFGDNGIMRKELIDETFEVLVKVLHEHNLESIRNFNQ
jgi:hypothetical protein